MSKRDEMLKMLEERLDTSVTIIDKDTKFKFKCDGCRDGSSKCCCNRNDAILINPYDIYKLQRGLNKTSAQVLDKYVEVLTGYDSGLPIMKLGTKQISYTGEEVCKFIKRRTNEDGTVGQRYCSIHNFKPGVCSIFPLGRVTPIDEEEVIYILQDVNCGLIPTEDDPEITIKDWVPDLDNADKAYKAYFDMLCKIEQIIDFKKLNKSTKVPKTIKDEIRDNFTSLICNFDSDKDFFEQFENNVETGIIYLKEASKTLKDFDKKVVK